MIETQEEIIVPMDIIQSPFFNSDPEVTKTDSRILSSVQNKVATPPELAGGGHEIRPPWVREDGSAAPVSPTDKAIQEFATEIQSGAGPFALDQAIGLLNATQEVVGVVGVAILTRIPDWNEDLFALVAAHEDLAVPLFAIQALRDMGRDDEAAMLSTRVRDRMEAVSDWTELVQRGQIPGTALRGLLEWGREAGDGAPRTQLIEEIIQSDTADYEARMAALLEMRELVGFEEYRNIVRDEYARSLEESGTVWREGLERLATRLEGPVDVHHGPQMLTINDVDVSIAREYPTMYEDLALRLALLLRQEDSLIGVGVTDRLREVIKQAHQWPLSNEEALALQRLGVLAEKITESDVSGRVPPAPPGS